jgi:hypothetical protein
MSVYIVDDEQRRDRLATPMRPLGSGGAGASAGLALLDDVPRHRSQTRICDSDTARKKAATNNMEQHSRTQDLTPRRKDSKTPRNQALEFLAPWSLCGKNLFRLAKDLRVSSMKNTKEV